MIAEQHSSQNPADRSGTVADLGEDALVGGLIGRFRDLPPWVPVGPGDDAAVVSLPARADGAAEVVASTDTLVEGEDFRRAWFSGHEVGVKLAAQNFADIAAMGAVPLALLVSLAAPPDLPATWASDVAAGLEEEAARAGAHVIGGDVSGAGQLVLTGTALGRFPAGGRAVLRSGARAGDVIALAGVVGHAAAGLALLVAGEVAGEGEIAGEGEAAAGGPLVAAQRAPRPPYPAGPAAAEAGATSMIDTSDGLIRDAARLARASGVSLDLDPDALIPDDALEAAARRLGDPALALLWVLTGGEDHALLATFPPGTALPEGWRVIGRVVETRSGATEETRSGATEETRSASVLVAGVPWTGPTGYTHFTGG